MTTAELPAPQAGDRGPWLRPLILPLILRVVAVAGLAVARAKTWELGRTGPGLAGMVLVSAAAGGVFGFWWGVGVAGVFLLRVDSRR